MKTLWTRREFVKAVGAMAALASGRARARPSGLLAVAQAAPRPKVCLLATEIRKYSHAQHFIDRLLEGYGWQGKHHRPPVELVSLYVDQFPDGDLTWDRVRRHKVRLYSSIPEALTRGGSKLAVDGVIIIAEHGDYPVNAKGQRRYPRYRFFKEVVKVFEESSRAVPVFNDKHLSTKFEECAEMVEDSRRLGFPFLAGSSLPVTWRIPSVEVPMDTDLEETVCAAYGGVDSYDIHGLETAQCMSERRRGGEVGVKSVHAVRGERVWELLEDRAVTRELLLAALARSHKISAPLGYTYPVLEIPRIRRACPGAIAYYIEHLDGFRTTLFLLNGLTQDFCYAGRVRGTSEIISCQMHLPMPPSQTTLADFFNPQMNNIERMIVEGKAPYPVERTLLTSGMTLFGVESLYRGEVELLTPELKVAYRANPESTYWRV